VRFERQRREER
jgi:hypothetical protein